MAVNRERPNAVWGTVRGVCLTLKGKCLGGRQSRVGERCLEAEGISMWVVLRALGAVTQSPHRFLASVLSPTPSYPPP